jgi:hypothetical protein
MSRFQNIQPMMQQVMPSAMQMMNESRMLDFAMDDYNDFNSNALMKKSVQRDIFADYGNSYEQQIQKTINEVGFQELEKTSEYMETHYYKKRAGNCPEFYSENRFMREYMLWLVGASTGPFLTSTFIDIGMRFLPFALSVLDLPFEQSDSYKKNRQAHKFKSDKKRGINITAGGNLVLFKKEIKEGKCEIKNDLMMIHRYKHLNSSEEEDEAIDMLIN